MSTPSIDAFTAHVVFWAKCASNGDGTSNAKGAYRNGLGNGCSDVVWAAPAAFDGDNPEDAADYVCFEAASVLAEKIKADGIIPLSEVSLAVISDDPDFVAEFNRPRKNTLCNAQFPLYQTSLAFLVSREDRIALMDELPNLALLQQILTRGVATVES